MLRLLALDQLLYFLTHCVRLLTEAQINDLCGRRTRGQAGVVRRGLKRQLLLRQAVLCAPRLCLEAPLAEWRVGAAPPDFQRLSYLACTRWQSSCVPTAAYVASRRAADLYGGRGGALQNPLQATHDVCVSEVFLTLLRTNSDAARRWVGEDALESALWLPVGRRPDAALLDAEGRLVRAVEILGGSYSPLRIAEFHEHCARAGWEYDLW